MKLPSRNGSSRMAILINELEPLLEVNTDKVDTEIPAPASGTVLKILMQEGTPPRWDEFLAFIGKPGENVDSVRCFSVKCQGQQKSQPEVKKDLIP